MCVKMRKSSRKLPDIIRSRAVLRKYVEDWKRAGDKIGVVPTMGALHAGHLSLVKAAEAEADRVIVTIFVNPKQFNNPQDLANYPRTEQEDAEKLAPFDVDMIYVPDPEEIYPDGFSTQISVSGVSEGLCGRHRPGHFDGVATVVAKLLLQTGADRGFFGEKDYQQLKVIRRLVQDLDIPFEAVGCPTVRDADGMALSSRNTQLSADERNRAAALFTTLKWAQKQLMAGAPVTETLDQARQDILAAGFEEVEYLELRDEETFAPVSSTPEASARLLVAAWMGSVRLIDNIEVC